MDGQLGGWQKDTLTDRQTGRQAGRQADRWIDLLHTDTKTVSILLHPIWNIVDHASSGKHIRKTACDALVPAWSSPTYTTTITDIMISHLICPLYLDITAN